MGKCLWTTPVSSACQIVNDMFSLMHGNLLQFVDDTINSNFVIMKKLRSNYVPHILYSSFKAQSKNVHSKNNVVLFQAKQE